MPSFPPHFSLESVIRPNILALQPYRCARDDYQSGILLDANENALGHSIPKTNGLDLYASSQLHRYPDPSQIAVKTGVASMRNLPSPDHVFLGVGSDEVIDLLMRVCCIPAHDKILITPPTYGMYSVCAQTNDLKVERVNLDVVDTAFQPELDKMKAQILADPTIKLVFLCSPGNPTGTLISLASIKSLLEFPDFKGIVVVDEAYIDFAPGESTAVSLIPRYANLCVLQTLSKSFGLAAIRLGMALAQPPLIRILSNTKAPYNISALTASLALSALTPEGIDNMKSKAGQLVRSRGDIITRIESLRPLGVGSVIGGNHANFVLVPILKHGSTRDEDRDNDRSKRVYYKLAEELGVVVRYRGGEYGCEGCLRITIGTEEENDIMLARLEKALKET
ncbi:histidinol-phosphate transaminase [Tulasnella sp. 419]|nr:histidinol-phosphate transaminase [Tulasnella sp. 418]KAG8970712.1 histidinol-phosphate transaminase [Tulasnella sp. 419]